MKKFLLILSLVLFAVIAQAQEVNASVDTSSNKGLAAIGAGIAVFGAGLGIGMIGYSGLQGMAKQPEASKEIKSSLIVAAALIEGVAFFALIVCAMVIFV